MATGWRWQKTGMPTIWLLKYVHIFCQRQRFMFCNAICRATYKSSADVASNDPKLINEKALREIKNSLEQINASAWILNYNFVGFPLFLWTDSYRALCVSFQLNSLRCRLNTYCGLLNFYLNVISLWNEEWSPKLT